MNILHKEANSEGDGKPQGEGFALGIHALKQRFMGKFSDNKEILLRHGKGESWHPSIPPDLVIYPQTTEEVSAAVKICDQYNIPIIAFGVGTSLEGHLLAVNGGVSIDLGKMNKILDVFQDDLDCHVQAGVTRKQLNLYLRDQGLFFSVDPGADASLGGMAATRASGTNAMRYGTMKDVVIGLTVVLPDGKIVKTGGRARKSSSGYDLTRLMIGSEGTLGIITELRIKLFAIPHTIIAGVAQYASLEDAVNVVIATMQSSIPIARIEIMDALQMKACIQYSKLDGYFEQPTLFFEFNGTDKAVEEQVMMVKEISDEFGGSEFQWANLAEERNKLWTARHNAYYAALALSPGKTGVVTDVCVPISRLPESILRARELLDNSGLIAPIVGHVGDGNFHTSMLVDASNPDEIHKAEALAHEIARLAISLGGTCSGEHGIGLGKIDLMVEEHGAEAIDLMIRIKQMIDPKNLMNPGKILPQHS